MKIAIGITDANRQAVANELAKILATDNLILFHEDWQINNVIMKLGISQSRD